MSEKGLMLVVAAAEFAARRHVNQRRKGAQAEPYFNHLAEVAALLVIATGGTDSALVAAAYLHDTLEDTPTEYEEVFSLFGEDVAALIAAVTDDKSLPKAERKRLQIAHAAKAAARARLLKIADKISNLRSLGASPPADWDRARALEYVDWAERVVAGCRGLNAGLETLFDGAAAQARLAIAARV
jgi:(p)ppGpp synthase/HD superfamily hydrolase